MITLPRARALLAQAVTTQPPGFRYMTPNPGEHSCFYRALDAEFIVHLRTVRDFAGGLTYRRLFSTLEYDDPRRCTGCLIGVALSLAGEHRHLDFDSSVRDLAIKFPDMMTGRAANYLAVAQSAQDQGWTWQEAYKKAEYTEELKFND